MRKKRILISVLVLILSFVPGYAKESFYQTIINASYLGDFAFNSFPLSLWADFGISGIELMQGLTTKIYVRIEAGTTERSLKQYPSSGDIIENRSSFDSLSYSVAFSDGSAIFEQGVLADPDREGRDMVSISISMRMRWEQAFATFRDIRKKNYAGVFGNSLLFPDTAGTYVGAPELSGNMYFLSNSFSFSASLDRLESDYIAPNGYKVDASMVFAPFWLGNNFGFISPDITTDAYRFRISGEYDYTIFEKKNQAGKNLYSLYITTSSSATFLFGNSVPKYLQDKNFMGKNVVARLFYADLYARLQLNGPEILSLGTYPAIYLIIQNGVNAGALINSKTSKLDAEFLGGFGLGTQITMIGYLRAFFEYYYVYTPIFGESAGGFFSYGCYFTMLF